MILVRPVIPLGAAEDGLDLAPGHADLEFVTSFRSNVNEAGFSGLLLWGDPENGAGRRDQQEQAGNEHGTTFHHDSFRQRG